MSALSAAGTAFQAGTVIAGFALFAIGTLVILGMAYRDRVQTRRPRLRDWLWRR